MLPVVNRIHIPGTRFTHDFPPNSFTLMRIRVRQTSHNDIMNRTKFLLGILCALALQPTGASSATNETQMTQRRWRGFRAPARGVYKAQIVPHWFDNNKCFWYRNDLSGRAREFILVDAEQGKRTRAFDHAKLAAALSKAAGQEFSAERLPFDEIEFIDDGKAIRFEAAGKKWHCDLESCECRVGPGDSAQRIPVREGALASAEVKGGPVSPFSDVDSPAAATQEEQNHPQTGNQGRTQRQRRANDEPRETLVRSRRSPDGKWMALVKEHNLFLRAAEGGPEKQLTQDGKADDAYGRLEWAPDSKALVAWRIEPGDHKPVYLVQSSPPGGGRAILKTRPYDLPGDKLTAFELNVFDPATGQQVKPAVDRFEHGWESPQLRWNRDQHHFAYTQVDRGHQRFRVIEVDALSGAVRNLIDEKSQTFIWTAHTESLRLRPVNWLEKTDELIYASEMDGWRHLYLVDTKAGLIKNQMTRGEFVVRAIDFIDEEARQVWFEAGGRNPGQDPYFLHYYRINFDGTGLVALTEGNGNHTVRFSPDRKYLIDTYSRVDLAPRHEFRRASDGALVCPLEEADISELKASGWEPPEVFTAKGRDGKTDIWGIICRPPHFDPNKKYPVIEQIYAGPQSSYVPKSFSGMRRFSNLTDLGFVVVQIDGMGTANRSKAFHDVCWKNLKDAGLPDRILWMKAAAAKYPYLDLSRVGVYGNSAGGQNAAAALLFHPEFYKVGVASCGCHDNRMDKASWNEQWMGYPVGPQYAECSNIENAGRLQGKLFLIVGEMDENVPPESTLRFVDALIKAGKDFDLLVIPGAGHGMGGSYGQRRMQDFFVRHLLGKEPPDRNATRNIAGRTTGP